MKKENSVSLRLCGESKGKLIGASLGPGDPGLITRRAWTALTSGARWLFPVSKKGGSSHALDIAVRAGLDVPVDAIPLVFPMSHDAEVLARAWRRASVQTKEVMKSGRDAVFLVEGDASTYSTFSHLARSVQALDAKTEVETIAGVPSFHAAAADLGQPIADTDDTVAIVPASYGIAELDQLLSHFDTLVLLKVKPLIDDIIDWLVARGLTEHASFIEKAGTPAERIVRDVTLLKGEKVNYLSLLLVRNPGRVRGPLTRGCRKKQDQPQGHGATDK